MEPLWRLPVAKAADRASSHPACGHRWRLPDPPVISDLAYVFGRDPMYGHRAWCALGRPAIVWRAHAPRRTPARLAISRSERVPVSRQLAAELARRCLARQPTRVGPLFNVNL
jgi:hypothetical protein